MLHESERAPTYHCPRCTAKQTYNSNYSSSPPPVCKSSKNFVTLSHNAPSPMDILSGRTARGENDDDDEGHALIG